MKREKNERSSERLPPPSTSSLPIRSPLVYLGARKANAAHLSDSAAHGRLSAVQNRRGRGDRARAARWGALREGQQRYSCCRLRRRWRRRRRFDFFPSLFPLGETFFFKSRSDNAQGLFEKSHERRRSPSDREREEREGKRAKERNQILKVRKRRKEFAMKRAGGRGGERKKLNLHPFAFACVVIAAAPKGVC